MGNYEKGLSNKLSIKSWAQADRPREKLLAKGRKSLTDAELIGILIGSGSVETSAIDLAKMILQTVDNDLSRLARLTVNDLRKFKGIGEAKAIAIISALELGRRRKETLTVEKPQIKSPEDIYALMSSHLIDLEKEEFWIVLLNRANRVIREIQISSGGVSGTLVDPKIIFKHALEHLASHIVLVHNHPSGTLKPSQSDLNLTNKLKQAGDYMEIPIIDHLIFTDDGFFSFKEEDLI